MKDRDRLREMGSKLVPVQERIFGEGTLLRPSCDGLSSVVIGNSVTTVGEGAFYNCTGLISAIIGTSVASLPKDAFYNCNQLTAIAIPNSVSSIGWGAFGYCEGLTSLDLGTGLTYIDIYAFNNCNSLTTVTIPSGVTTTGDGAFASCDERDLNYDKYFIEGSQLISKSKDYHSHNTYQLDFDGMRQLLASLDMVMEDDILDFNNDEDDFLAEIEPVLEDYHSHNTFRLDFKGMSGILFMILISKLINKMPLVSYFGRNCGIILGTHWVILWVLRRHLYFITNDVLEYIAYFILVVIVSVPLIKICLRYFPRFIGEKDLFKLENKL